MTPRGSDDNHQAVAEFQGQTMDDKDLVTFFKKYVKKYTEGKDDVVSKFVGDKDKQSGQTEASLDIQYIMGVNPGIKSEFWLYNSMDFCGDLANWTSAILADKNPPLIHSVSYGWQGDLSQLHCEDAKVKVVDDNFAKLAAKGISIVFASGDSGSGYSPGNNQCIFGGKPIKLEGVVKEHTEARRFFQCCHQAAKVQGAAGWTFTPGKKAPRARRAPGNCTIFSSVTGNSTATDKSKSGLIQKAKVQLWPSWPASSGWVTSVGATRFVGQKVGNEEMATDQFGSGGGFSKMFTIAADAKWQQEAVEGYLKDAPMLPPKGSYPPGGRATPDVSALGEGYMVAQNGHFEPVGGTSASTPAFSGLISLINDARLKAGKKQMGFLNPWIYQNTDSFTDITKGDNRRGRGPFVTPYGFNCTKGWDPVTGVGTPIFDKMLKAALK